MARRDTYTARGLSRLHRRPPQFNHSGGRDRSVGRCGLFGSLPTGFKRLVYRRETTAVTLVQLVDIAWLPWDEQEGAVFNSAAAES